MHIHDGDAAGVRDLAWLAGFIDGEGCFHFRRATGRRAGHFNYYYPAIRISNTHTETLAVVRGILDRNGLHHNVSWRHPKNGYLSSWDIEARGAKRLELWLTTLIPFLRTKRAQAEDVLQFIRLRAADTSFRDYSEEEVAILQRIAKRSVVLPRKVYEHVSECPQGHPLSGDNVYVWKNQRQCRICKSEAGARRYAKVKGQRSQLREERPAARAALAEQAKLALGDA